MLENLNSTVIYVFSFLFKYEFSHYSHKLKVFMLSILSWHKFLGKVVILEYWLDLAQDQKYRTPRENLSH